MGRRIRPYTVRLDDASPLPPEQAERLAFLRQWVAQREAAAGHVDTVWHEELARLEAELARFAGAAPEDTAPALPEIQENDE